MRRLHSASSSGCALHGNLELRSAGGRTDPYSDKTGSSFTTDKIGVVSCAGGRVGLYSMIDQTVWQLRPGTQDNLTAFSRVFYNAGNVNTVDRFVSGGFVLAGPFPGRHGDMVGRRTFALLERWQRIFDAAGLDRPSAPIQCGSVTTIRGILARSDFLTLLSCEQVTAELEAGSLTPIASAIPNTARLIGVITRRDWVPDRAAGGVPTPAEGGGAEARCGCCGD